ncbi:FeoC-like transcriptional regulator [Corynebacterium sp. CQ3829_602738]
MRPMQAVMAAIQQGARSRAEIRRTTGLTDSTVDAVIHHLERTGRLTLEELGSSCAGGDCGSCIAAASSGMTCADRPKGPVALVLGTRPGV